LGGLKNLTRFEFQLDVVAFGNHLVKTGEVSFDEREMITTFLYWNVTWFSVNPIRTSAPFLVPGKNPGQFVDRFGGIMAPTGTFYRATFVE
jgi:hypothetical protein